MTESAMGAQRRESVLHARAVSDEMILGTRGVSRYVEFERGDWQSFEGSHSHPERWHKQLVAQHGGLIVNRWNLSGDRLPSYIRFDKKVRVTRKTRSGHLRWHTTRYIYPSSRGDASAKQIDVHPLVRSRLSSEQPAEVFFCIEGCLKADAMASQGWAAVSVPSVTLWQVPDTEFRPYVKLFKAASRVFVLPDSDYLTKTLTRMRAPSAPPKVINPMVRLQTDNAVAWLREPGVRAVYMVPPYASADEVREHSISWEDRWKPSTGSICERQTRSSRPSPACEPARTSRRGRAPGRQGSRCASS